MASSRIYVRGLPPNLSESDFRNHFGRRFSATDFQLKPQRRIGYVGFENAEDAAKAARFFHKSFIRMSRLHVELAKSPDEAPEPRHSQRKKFAVLSPSHRSADSSITLKRKRSLKESDESGHPVIPSTSVDQFVQEIPSISETYDASKARSVSDAANPSEPYTGRDETSDKQDSKQLRDESGAQGDDDEWMRSRTTRLLGLQDDDEDLLRRAAPHADRHESPTGAPAARHDGSNPTEDHARLADPDTEPSESGPATETTMLSKYKHSGRRLFLRNLAYNVTEDQLKTAFTPFGSLVEVKVPRDFSSGKAKGFAFAQYETEDQAKAAVHALDGSIFQGRLLHIMPAAESRQGQTDEFAISQLPLKKRKIIEKRQESASSTFNWNALYMNSDAVISSAASRLGVSKAELLDPTSSDAAVKQAQIETHSIQEAKQFFESHGVDLETFGRSDRDGNAILVKNFKFDTSVSDLRALFAQSGDVTRVLMPPGGTIAIVEFPNKVQAKTVLSAFAYRKFKDSILFLERAPKDLFRAKPSKAQAEGEADNGPSEEQAQVLTHDVVNAEDLDTATLFVRNLNFSTTSERLQQAFNEACGPVRSARVVTRTDTKRPGETLSMGFGFVEFATADQAKAALLAMNGYLLEGHDLQIKASHKGLDAAADRRRDDQAERKRQRKSRLIVKNLPFEASKKDVRTLFGSYGQVKAVRMPKKINNSSRGYAFVDFSTPQQAEKAMDLSKTHLLGRRLVIDYAEGDAEDPETEIEKMQQKVGRQSDQVALQRLTTGDRKKFIASGDAQDEV